MFNQRANLTQYSKIRHIHSLPTSVMLNFIQLSAKNFLLSRAILTSLYFGISERSSSLNISLGQQLKTPIPALCVMQYDTAELSTLGIGFDQKQADYVAYLQMIRVCR
ncbi:hypothetical protein CEXT_664321 [Caerostris extrusa]|uniref:Uncharacterized protein n=1 Tax=Caerostris extrusa TaxID=172846 RepID=A0AAV4X4W8_CAEEX|nr:hypothetical protein CEXT_664321 [Caerostris extrusa]